MTSAHPDSVIKEWDQQMSYAFKAQRLDDPHLQQKAEEYARRLGIETPLLYVTEEFPAIFGGDMPNAAAIMPPDPKFPSVFAFTRQQFTIHGYEPHGGSAIPNEVLWTLGHEMQHVKQGFSYLKTIEKYPSLIGMAGAAGGFYLLDKAIARSKKQKEALSDENLKSALTEVTQEEREKLKQLLGPDTGPQSAVTATFNGALKAAEYLAAALIGGVAGKFATRHLAIATEFEADRVGAELCGDSRAGIRVLKAMQEHQQNRTAEELRALRAKITPRDIVQSYFEYAHPSYVKRIARLEAMAVKMEEKAGKSMQAATASMGSMLDHAPALLSKLEKTAVRLHLP